MTYCCTHSSLHRAPIYVLHPHAADNAKVESSAGSAGAETAPHNNNGAVAVAGAGGNTAVASAAAAVAEV